MKYSTPIKKVAIVGCGIIGASVAFLINKQYPNIKIVIYEPNEIGSDQTNRNSNLLHTGLLSSVDSDKERFCEQSYTLLPEIVKSLNVEHKKITKQIKCTDKIKFDNLKNKKVVKLLNNLHIDSANNTISFDTYLINFKDLSQKMIRSCNKNVEIIKAKYVENKRHDIVFVCAGSNTLSAVNDLVKNPLNYYNVYVDGKYLYYDNNLNTATYIVQNNKLPFLGVHTTPTLDNKMKLGPDSRFSLLNILKLKSLNEFMARFRFIKKYWIFGLQQSLNYFNIFFKRKYSVDFGKHYKNSHSMRTILIDQNGEIVDSFCIIKLNNIITALNTASPAATCCLKIAESMLREAKLHA